MNESTTSPLPPQEFSVICQKILARARQMFQSNPDWITFFRENVGASSLARRMFKSSTDFLAFERTAEYQEIQRLVGQLRHRKVSPSAAQEPTRVITVRLPECLHESLRLEAEDHQTSINKLCISKLLQALDEMPKSSKSSANGNGPRGVSATSLNGALPGSTMASGNSGMSGGSSGTLNTTAPAGSVQNGLSPLSGSHSLQATQPAHPMQPAMSAPPSFRSTYTPPSGG